MTNRKSVINVKRCEQSAARAPNEKVKLPAAVIAAAVGGDVKYKRVITQQRRSYGRQAATASLTKSDVFSSIEMTGNLFNYPHNVNFCHKNLLQNTNSYLSFGRFSSIILYL